MESNLAVDTLLSECFLRTGKGTIINGYKSHPRRYHRTRSILFLRRGKEMADK